MNKILETKLSLNKYSKRMFISNIELRMYKTFYSKKSIILYFLIISISIPIASAQVTIGADIAPQKSTLLELKEYQPTADNVTSGKGFMMPRVKLVSRSSLSPIISDNEVTEDDKKNNEGLQIYHVGGNNMPAGVKVWDGVSWSDLNNSAQLANNGVTNNADTIQLGGILTKATKLTAGVAGSNLEYNATVPNTNMLITGNAKLGVNTSLPETSVDINGDLAVRNIPVLEDGFFTDIGVDEKGKIYRRNDSFTSYSVYLGFDPMAATHVDTIPVKFEAGYIYKLEGISIGACEGTLVYFTITFVGNRYVGATLQAVATRDGGTKVYPSVALTAAQSVFNVNQSLEYLAGNTLCGAQYGHTLQYIADTNEIIVTFLDEGKYFKDAGTFAITNLIQLSILGTDQIVE